MIIIITIITITVIITIIVILIISTLSHADSDSIIPPPRRSLPRPEARIQEPGSVGRVGGAVRQEHLRKGEYTT